MNSEYSARPVVIPATATGPEAEDFRATVAVRNAVYRELNGSDDETMTAEEVLPLYTTSTRTRRLVWLATVGGRVAGRISVDLPLENDSVTANVEVLILPEFRGRGVGSAAAETALQAAAAAGRTSISTETVHEPGGVFPSLASPTGFGSIPADARARFAMKHGFTLGQVNRASALDLTTTPERIDAAYARALTHAAGYDVLQWTGDTPPEHLAGLAVLMSRMSTDAPHGEVEVTAEVWDADRVRAGDARIREGGLMRLMTVARHRDSGVLAAYNVLLRPRREGAATLQADTLVRADHRGKRLGMVVKCAGLRTWRDLAPDSPHVLTWNAEENRPMLDINESLGFVARRHLGAWHLTV